MLLRVLLCLALGFASVTRLDADDVESTVQGKNHAVPGAGGKSRIVYPEAHFFDALFANEGMSRELLRMLKETAFSNA
jgi:hypothetical protein